MPDHSSLRDRILSHLNENAPTTYNKSELSRALSIPSKERAELRELVSEMEQRGELVQGRRSRYGLPGVSQETKAPLTGVLRILGNGHGSVRLDNEHPTGQTYVHIPSGNTATALTGDHVLVELTKREAPKWMQRSRKQHARYQKNAEERKDELVGKVTEIIKRAEHKLVGTLFKKNGRFYIEPDTQTLPAVVQVNELGDAQTGQKVVLSLEKWNTEHLPPVGNVVQILGNHDDPGVDVLGIIHRHSLELEFPPEVDAEADQVADSIPEEEIALRYDCRTFPIITIDPHDARDHDDAVWVERLDGSQKGWRLHVHIADVSHYVRSDTALDKEAYKRGNSTYMVDRVIPMLPTVLSNGICSLVPDEDRLTKCAVITFDPQGRVTKSAFHSAVIESKARLSYEDAQEMLDNPAHEHELTPHVREAWKLASLLRKKRFANGALDLEFPEYRIQLDDQGVTTGYKINTHTASHQLIEEFMLVANEAAALSLKNAKKPTLYRSHEDPDYDKLDEFGEQARILGFKAGDLTSKNELQKLIDQLGGTAVEQTLKLALLKSLKRASYTNEPLGHYGLAKVNYTHFTSPIRRYADLIVHRSLQPLLQNPPKSPDRTPNQARCEEIADHLSKTERTSADAEMESKKYKLFQWLDTLTPEKLGSNAPVFDALITDVRPMGLFIELKDTMLRGVIKNKDFPPGHWNFDNKTKRYHSSRKTSIGLADAISVKVKFVDFDRQRIDFMLASE